MEKYKVRDKVYITNYEDRLYLPCLNCGGNPPQKGPFKYINDCPVCRGAGKIETIYKGNGPQHAYIMDIFPPQKTSEPVKYGVVFVSGMFEKRIILPETKIYKTKEEAQAAAEKLNQEIIKEVMPEYKNNFLNFYEGIKKFSYPPYLVDYI